MASLGSYIRSAARATFSAYRSLPIRWRLAGGSAALTFVILAAFAVLVGVFTTNQLRGQFNDQVDSAASQLRGELAPLTLLRNGGVDCDKNVSLPDYVSPEHAQIRIYGAEGFLDDEGLLCTQNDVRIRGQKPPTANPDFAVPTGQGVFQELGYRVDVLPRMHLLPRGSGDVWLMYAAPLSDLGPAVTVGA